jgi:hypothetical protein
MESLGSVDPISGDQIILRFFRRSKVLKVLVTKYWIKKLATGATYKFKYF